VNAAGIRSCLLRRAHELGLEFQQALVYYGIEGFLGRLAKSEFASRLIVKGATMLTVWDGAIARPTRDIDFLGRIEAEAVEEVVRACLKIEVPEDGLVFEDYVATAQIIVDGRYPGISIKTRGHLDGAKFVLRLDVGVDDATVPEPEWVDYPTLLDGPRPRILTYHPATAVAEKFEAVVSLGLANSRMKDFYDLWMLATSLSFARDSLRGSIKATFERRGTPLPSTTPPALTEEFYGQPSTAKMWNTFARRLESSNIRVPSKLSEVAEVIMMFIMPVLSDDADGQTGDTWIPSEGWR
jgi:hypothetical protein